MTTARIDITGNFIPDAGVYLSKLASELTLTNTKNQFCYVMPAPTGADLGGELCFEIPQNYSSTPKLVFRGIIDGTPANTFGIGAQLLQRAASDSVDTAYEAEDTASNGTWTGYADEDEYELSITLTPASAFTVGNSVYIKAYRDDSVDTTTWNFLLTRLSFEYTTT